MIPSSGCTAADDNLRFNSAGYRQLGMRFDSNIPPDNDFVIPSNGKKFFVSPSSANKLIGNAVPQLLAYHVKKTEKLWDVLIFKVSKGFQNSWFSGSYYLILSILFDIT